MAKLYTLIKNATVVSMEGSPQAVLEECDILIENDRIKAIGQQISAPTDEETITIDATDCIVTPGFVDGHHHMWQHLLRGLTVDWSLYGYCCHLRSVYGSLYTPDDVYFANYAASLSLLNNGVTTVLDHCHVINSPAHADAAVKGLKDAGIRGTFCYGFYPNPPVPGDMASAANDKFSPVARLEDAARVRQQYFADNEVDNSLITFGVALNEPPLVSREDNVAELDASRKLGARIITVHTSVMPGDIVKGEVIQNFSTAGRMAPDLVFSHGAYMTKDEMQALQQSGAGVVGTPDTELQMGMGYPVVWKALDQGCRACLGLDITSNQGNDFIVQMRLALQTQRARQLDRKVAQLLPRKTADAMRLATLGGAEVMQMESSIGSVTAGKKADLVIFRCDDIDTVPVVDPIGTVVFHASPKNIETVIVNGKIVKRDGKLVGVDWASLSGQVKARSQRLRDDAAKVDMTNAENLFKAAFEKGMEEAPITSF
ncbi:hypothetical protein BJY01DRAFT_208449 [Aspergillus pseudoustus]|uniref:Amidohydrolase-related domain-containing protein n=1 Tax=Aspergillus pseudoustus TaxID=1810923 RepID=A0ABR4KJ87_9EURO